MSRTTNRRRLTPATVISVLALFFALGGSAFAAATVGTADLQNQAVTTPKLADGAVTGKKIATQAVGPAKIALGAVRTAKIIDAAVTTAKLADDSVTTDKIADGQVTDADLADNSVKTDKIADHTVTSAKISDGQVRAPDLGPITERVISDSLDGGGAHASVAVSCLDSERVLGGGHSTNGVNVVNLDSRRSGNGWLAYFRNNEGVSRTIRVFAYCLAT
jgi:hypothetical protein